MRQSLKLQNHSFHTIPININLTDDLNILLKGCIRYDRLSQEKLYRQFYPDLFALCHKFFDDEHDILTALNNGMMNVFNSIEKYDANRGELAGWIYSIVRNAAISVVRTKRREMITNELVGDMLLEASVNPLGNFDEEVILRFLSTLSATTRAVFNLFYMEGFMIKEISQSLDMKEGTVKWHLSESRTKLKTNFYGQIKHSVYAK